MASLQALFCLSLGLCLCLCLSVLSACLSLSLFLSLLYVVLTLGLGRGGELRRAQLVSQACRRRMEEEPGAGRGHGKDDAGGWVPRILCTKLQSAPVLRSEVLSSQAFHPFPSSLQCHGGTQVLRWPGD